MTKWLCFIPCIKSRRSETNVTEEKDLTNPGSENDRKNESHEKYIKDIGECVRNIIKLTEENEKPIIIHKDETIKEELYKIEKNLTTEPFEETQDNFMNNMRSKSDNKNKLYRTLISCTLHESLNDFCQAKITHTNVKACSSSSKTNEGKPRNTLVFRTVMVNGEPSTTRYKTTEPNIIEERNSKDHEGKLGEEIKSSDIKLIFSHDVLEYLTKTYLHDKDNNLNRDKSGENDLVVCTLFPKRINSNNNIRFADMEIDNNNNEINENPEMSNHYMEVEDTNNYMDVDDSCPEEGTSLMTHNEHVFTESQLGPRSEYQLLQTSSNQPKNLQTSMSKSSPHMQQQENNMNNSNSREIIRLRRNNISKKVSWKENVEVCFFNHSSKSANEILQEEQPLIDHEVYWTECVGEMDRKRREKWLKIRADEQRCLTGDGQFHDYFAYRMHQLDDDDIPNNHI